MFKFTFFKKTSLVAFFVSLVFLSTSFYLFFPQPTLAQSRPIAIIRVATLTSKSDSTLIVDQQGQTLTINTDVQTLFRRRVGGNSSLDEMQNGDSLSIVGFWEDEPRTTVYARMVRDLSVEIRTGTFTGTVTSLFGNGFVISYLNREPVNVTITPDAQLLNRKNEPIALSDILTDHRVQVRGTYNRQQQAINQVTQVRDTSLPSSGSTLRLPIAIIRQAILNSISDTTLSVTQGDQPLTILTNDQTRLRRRLGGDSSLTEMQPGDSLSIVGWYTDDIRTTVQARLVRDLSIEIRTGTFSGKVVSVSDDSFIFTYLKNNLTVTVESQTQIINRLGNPITLADLQPDHRVRVRGTYNGQQQTITQVTEVRDFDLPQRSSVSRMPIAIINQANLESKDGATLTVSKGTQTYTILTDQNTRLRRRLGGDSSIDEMQPGDQLSIIGRYTDETRTTVQSHLVRDLSIEIRTGTFLGQVVSLGDNQLTINIPRYEGVTATISPDTAITNRIREPVSLTDIQAQDRIYVRGLFNSQDNSLTQVTEIRDLSRPPLFTFTTPTP